MKTAIMYGPRDVRVEDVEKPEIKAGDVLVRVQASGICGSDVHRYLGTDYGLRLGTYPMNSGHEYCGDVAELGSAVQTFHEGDKVTLGVAWTSGHLGAFSEYVYIPDADRRLCRLPDELSHVDGALIETLIVAARSFHRPNPRPEERVLILGAGPIGLCMLLYCRAMGIEDVTVSEPAAGRRALAARVGARTVDPARESLEEVVIEVTDGAGADVTFECAGEQSTLDQAFALTRSGSRIGLIGHYRQMPSFGVEPLVMRGMSVFAPMPGHPFFDECVQLVLEGTINLEQLVSHRYPLEQAQEAFEAASDVEASVKVLFTF
jgi:(R,R)-butanediol dehydrogenase/meso-butanediol dehydrogenase/diacetyl reductase